MSQNYAAGLSKYTKKGVLGLPEVYDPLDELDEKILQLARLIRDAKHVVVHTGAGISTAAGISDFRGPRGIWTAEKKKIKPAVSKPFEEAVPTFTHMAVRTLVHHNIVKFVISQNIDGLHLRSGLSTNHFTELHGNVFTEECRTCHALFLRRTPAATIGRKATGGVCAATRKRGTPCRGVLIDTVLDWCSPLPEPDLTTSTAHSLRADLNIVLGSTMQINPSGELPRSAKVADPTVKFVICNLQKTKFDDEADLVLRAKVDDIFRRLMSYLNIPVNEYQSESDPVLTMTEERQSLVRDLIQPPSLQLLQPLQSPLQKGKKRKTTPTDKEGTKKRKTEPQKSEKSEKLYKTDKSYKTESGSLGVEVDTEEEESKMCVLLGKKEE